MKHKKIILELAKIEPPCHICNLSKPCFQNEEEQKHCDKFQEYLSNLLERLTELRARKPKQKPYPEDSMEYRLAEYLKKWILKNNPNAKTPKDIQTWCRVFGDIIRLDKRDPEEIRKLIQWSQQHPFWFKNILSPSKLRKQYDRLTLEVNGRANNHDARFDNL